MTTTDNRPAPSGPGEYTATWTHDAIYANSPEDAARQARETHQDPGSLACVYDVSQPGTRTVTVDLNTPEEIDGPIRERPLPLDLAPISDEMLTRMRAEIDHVLAARTAAYLPAAILAAWNHEHPAAPVRPVSVTLTAVDYGSGAYWDTRATTAHFADSTTPTWQIGDHAAQELLRQHEDHTEPNDGDRLVVTFDPPAATVEH